MRNRSRLIALVVLLLAPLPSLCQEDPGRTSVARALELDKQGHMEAAISLLKPLVQLADGPLNGEDRGIAWAVLARTYQDIGSFDQARRCYEEALQILASAEGAASQYASALDNFGSLYKEERQFAVADELRHRALALYQHLSDHAREAIVLNNLAATAIEQNNQRRGRKYLRRAFEEIKHATDIGPDDLAAIYSNQGALFLLAGNPYRAQQNFEMSMALWERAFGPNHYWIGWGIHPACPVLPG